jgi:DNA-binding transcriptional LysR family regulator
MDSLGSLNAFVQAAEARSFTVAGRQLGVSSAAIGTIIGSVGTT